jgi:hypothetical protein
LEAAVDGPLAKEGPGQKEAGEMKLPETPEAKGKMIAVVLDSMISACDQDIAEFIPSIIRNLEELGWSKKDIINLAYPISTALQWNVIYPSNEKISHVKEVLHDLVKTAERMHGDNMNPDWVASRANKALRELDEICAFRPDKESERRKRSMP